MHKLVTLTLKKWFFKALFAMDLQKNGKNTCIKEKDHNFSSLLHSAAWPHQLSSNLFACLITNRHIQHTYNRQTFSCPHWNNLLNEVSNGGLSRKKWTHHAGMDTKPCCLLMRPLECLVVPDHHFYEVSARTEGASCYSHFNFSILATFWNAVDNLFWHTVRKSLSICELKSISFSLG